MAALALQEAFLPPLVFAQLAFFVFLVNPIPPSPPSPRAHHALCEYAHTHTHTHNGAHVNSVSLTCAHALAYVLTQHHLTNNWAHVSDTCPIHTLTHMCSPTTI